MKKIDAGKFFELSSVLRRHEGLSDVLSRQMPGVPIEMLLKDEQVRQIVIEHLDEIMDGCDLAELPMSILAIDRLRQTIRSDNDDNVRAVELQFGELHRRIRDELSLRMFLMVNPGKQDLYGKPTGSWDQVVKTFQDCIRDVEEASKCLALDRPTASVFHSMRIAEFGLIALAKALGVSYEYKNWDPVLKLLRHIAETDYQRLETQWKGQRQKFLDVLERLTAIKDALRNPTMHVRGTYTEEMAEDVYRSVKGFMKNLASWV